MLNFNHRGRWRHIYYFAPHDAWSRQAIVKTRLCSLLRDKQFIRVGSMATTQRPGQAVHLVATNRRSLRLEQGTAALNWQMTDGCIRLYRSGQARCGCSWLQYKLIEYIRGTNLVVLRLKFAIRVRLAPMAPDLRTLEGRPGSLYIEQDAIAIRTHVIERSLREWNFQWTSTTRSWLKMSGNGHTPQVSVSPRGG